MKSHGSSTQPLGADVIAPAVPVWVLLLCALLVALAAVAVLAFILRFLRGVIKLIRRDEDARKRETIASAAVVLLALTGCWIVTAEQRAAGNELDEIAELSVLDLDERSVDSDRPCGGRAAE